MVISKGIFFRSYEGKKSIIKTTCLALTALLPVITSCKAVTKSSSQSSENYAPTTASEPNNAIFFPRQEETDGERAVMDGETTGRLVITDSCIRLERDNSGGSLLIIWPPEFRLSNENGTIRILNGDGEIVAHIGDRVHVDGGGIPLLSMMDKSIQQQAPLQCSGPYWIIGNEITTISTSK
jgi:hypothetical protein